MINRNERGDFPSECILQNNFMVRVYSSMRQRERLLGLRKSFQENQIYFASSRGFYLFCVLIRLRNDNKFLRIKKS